MLELSEYLKIINEEDAPGLGAPPSAAGDTSGSPAAGTSPTATPAGGLGDLATGAAPLSAPSAGLPSDMSGGLGSPTAGGISDAKTAAINLKDGWDALEKYFKK